MKKTYMVILLLLLSANSLKAQDIDPGALFRWLELYEKSRLSQTEREAKFRAEQERYLQLKTEIDDYNSFVDILNQWQKLTDLKYKQLQMKYVSRIHDVKLDATIRTLQKQLLEQTRKLK